MIKTLCRRVDGTYLLPRQKSWTLSLSLKSGASEQINRNSQVLA